MNVVDERFLDDHRGRGAAAQDRVGVDAHAAQPRADGVQIRARDGLGGQHIGGVDRARSQHVQQQHVCAERARVLFDDGNFHFARGRQVQRDQDRPRLRRLGNGRHPPRESVAAVCEMLPRSGPPGA